jgi:hypothetical protein
LVQEIAHCPKGVVDLPIFLNDLARQAARLSFTSNALVLCRCTRLLPTETSRLRDRSQEHLALAVQIGVLVR